MNISDIARTEVKNIDFQSLKEAGIERTLEEFYILGNYPPLTAMKPVNDSELLSGNSQKEFDIYVHFQFCNQLCNFCHFHMDQKARDSEDSRVVKYLKSLKKEISLWNERIGGITARSVYIGGGTPSFMNAKQIEDLFNHLYSEINIPKGTTITFDMHPEIIHGGLHKLDILKDIGINRPSIGGVDLNDKVLKEQQRGHNSRDTIELIQQLKIRGFQHVVTDLIMGVPHQTPETWEKTLDLLIGDFCEIDCAMTFPLMFKATQINWRQYQRNPAIFPSVKERAVMQLIAMDKFAEAGYNHLPIYYFNRSDDHINDQQIRKFETLEETGLLGIGVSSFGFINGQQYFNSPNMDDYHVTIASKMLPVWRAAKLTPKNLFERAVMFGLKSRGVNKTDVKKKFGFDIDQEYGSIINKLKKVDLIESTSDYIQLTRTGMLFAEEICNQFVNERIKQRANYISNLVDSKDPTQRFNYNMVGHKL